MNAREIIARQVRWGEVDRVSVEVQTMLSLPSPLPVSASWGRMRSTGRRWRSVRQK